MLALTLKLGFKLQRDPGDAKPTDSTPLRTAGASCGSNRSIGLDVGGNGAGDGG